MEVLEDHAEDVAFAPELPVADDKGAVLHIH